MEQHQTHTGLNSWNALAKLDPYFLGILSHTLTLTLTSILECTIYD